MDNLHLASTIATGMVAAHRIAGRELVVGKSMALWRHDLELLGGFESVANVLAEDHALGNRIRVELGREVAVSSLPVWNIAVEKSVGHFFRRYLRWSVIHRTAIRFPTYLAESLLNPIPLAVIGFALRPSQGAAVTLAACAVLKPTLDAVAFSRLRREMFSWQAFGVVWVKDMLLFLDLGARALRTHRRLARQPATGALGSQLVPLVAKTPAVSPVFALEFAPTPRCRRRAPVRSPEHDLAFPRAPLGPSLRSGTGAGGHVPRALPGAGGVRGGSRGGDR